MSTYILGISAFYHDSAACLLKDGEIVAAAQEERFSRKKHDHRFPAKAIQYCLDEADIGPEALHFVVFYDKPLLKFERLLDTYVAIAPAGFPSFIKSMPLWIREKLWMPQIIQNQISGFEGKILFAKHHESHAASAFYPSPFEKAAILTIDGVGEWDTTTWGVGDGKTIDIAEEIHFPHSLGLLYSAFTYFTGFRVNSGEYKLMGLAPYGEPKYVSKILDQLIDLKDDGSFRLNLKYFNFLGGFTMTNRKFGRLFGGPRRQPESEITQREMDLARSIQVVTEEAIIRMVRHVHKETGLKNLCMAGGVALNCVGNGKIVREGPFEELWVQPAAGDAGGAVGAVYAIWHRYLERPRQVGVIDSMKGTRLGPRYSNQAIQKTLDDQGAVYRQVEPDAVPQQVAESIARGRVVGFFRGRMEFGPRALGGRSILGDPRDPEMQKKMNLKIKFRESFRPFAPSALLDRTPEVFELQTESPYMLLVAPVAAGSLRPLSANDESLSGLEKLSALRSELPAITHVDNSARIQTVDEKRSPAYYKVISAFAEKTGCPVVINTSFNVRGEPIVCTPEDAYRCFMRTQMDVLFLEDMMLVKEEQPEWAEGDDWRQEFTLD